MKTRLAFAAALALIPAAAGAQVLQERNLSMALAQEIAQGAVAACAAKNFAVTATVVDRAGLVRAVLRADRAVYDNAQRVLTLQGRVRATFEPPPRAGGRPAR